MTKTWILQRAFNLGRCLQRESTQHADAGRPHVRRDPSAICAGIARETTNLRSAAEAGDARRVFEARWHLNLWYGCLYQALGTRYEPRLPVLDVDPRA